jgi:hypothetical protein
MEWRGGSWPRGRGDLESCRRRPFRPAAGPIRARNQIQYAWTATATNPTQSRVIVIPNSTHAPPLPLNTVLPAPLEKKNRKKPRFLPAAPLPHTTKPRTHGPQPQLIQPKHGSSSSPTRLTPRRFRSTRFLPAPLKKKNHGSSLRLPCRVRAWATGCASRILLPAARSDAEPNTTPVGCHCPSRAPCRRAASCRLRRRLTSAFCPWTPCARSYCASRPRALPPPPGLPAVAGPPL